MAEKPNTNEYAARAEYAEKAGDAETLGGHPASYFAPSINPMPEFNGDIDTLPNGVVYLNWGNPAQEKLPSGDHPYILLTLLRPDGRYGYRVIQDIVALHLWAQFKAEEWGQWKLIQTL